MKSPLNMKLFLVFVFVLATYTIAFSQPGDPASDPTVPITGIEILIGAGALIGTRKLIRSRNKK